MATLKVNGEELVYTDTNPHEKNVIVLVHGNLSSHKWWEQTVNAIQPGLRVVTVDMRGFGGSSYNNPITLLDHLAFDITALCDSLQIKTATFVGWSLGGLVVMKIAQLRPDLAIKIALTCSVGHLGLRFIEVVGDATIPMQEIRKLKQLQVMDNAIKQKNLEMVKTVFKLHLITYVKERLRPFAQELTYVTLQQRNYFDSMFVIANPRIDISRIKAKVVWLSMQWLVLAGLQDIVIPMSNIQPTIDELKKRNYDHRVKIFEEGGHMLPLEHPEEYNKLVREFALE